MNGTTNLVEHAIIKIKTFQDSSTVSLAADTSTAVTISSYSIPSGYTPIGILELEPNNTGIVIERFTVANSLVLRLRSIGLARNAQPTVKVAFIKSGYIGP